MSYQAVITIVLLAVSATSHLSTAKIVKLCNDTNRLCPMTFGSFLNTLSEDSTVLQDNFTLVLEQAVHSVPVNICRMYVFENVTHLTLKGIDGKVATIDCANQASLGFINITVLNISGIMFKRCGIEITDHTIHRINNTVVLPLTIHPKLRVGIFAMNVKDLNFFEVTVKDSVGYGMIGINLLGQSRIRKSIFERSNYKTKQDYLANNLNCHKNLAECNGGNALFVYADLLHSDHMPISNCDYSKIKGPNVNLANLIISNADMSEGINFVSDETNLQGIAYTPTGNRNMVGGGGVSLILLQTSFQVNFTYENSILAANEGFSGGNIHISVYSYTMTSNITIENLMLFLSNEFSPGYVNPNGLQTPHDSGSGGGIYYEYGKFLSEHISNYSDCASTFEYNIRFHKLQLIHNRALNGGGIYIKLHQAEADEKPHYVNHKLIIDNCTFDNNKAFYGAGLHLNELQYKLVHSSKVNTNHCVIANKVFTTELKNSIFINQSIFKYHDSTDDAEKGEIGAGSVVFLNSVQDTLTIKNVTIVNSTFCTSILLIDSTIFCAKLLNITGNSNFANSESNGGGITFIGQSYFTLHPNTLVVVSNNNASNAGGGLYIPYIQHYNFQPFCFFQVFPKSKVKEIDEIEHYNASFEVMGNTATSGLDIYGGDLKTCFLSFWDVDSTTAYNLFVKTSNNTPSEPSRISSYANTLCFCKNNTMNCDQQNTTIQAFPGQIIKIQVAPVGQLNGLTKCNGINAIPLKSPGSKVKVRLLDNKTLNSSCNTLKLMILLVTKDSCFQSQSAASKSCEFNFHLIVQGIVEEYYWKKVTVQIQPCPCIYYNSYNNSKWTCQCMKILQKFGFKCHNELVEKMSASANYIGYRNNCTYVHEYCPPDYCNESKVRIHLNLDHNDQCINNRQGILCGKCADGYSHVLGSNRCMKCDNINLLLIFAFIVIGILLVWSISFLNLNVSTGLINGIIFYANIVKVNKDILYSTMSDSNPLVILMAWLNLDFGFEVCFFNGMNEFYKTLLQFVFPIYLWFLSLLIIYLSRHYQIMRKVFGRHSTQTLATILLLSFTKLLNVVCKIFSPVQLHYECNDGKTGSKFVWWSDGTVSYGKNSYHIFLLALAIITTIFGIIPYSMLLVLSPYLQRINHHKMFRTIAKIKPFLDAYEGPYNESSQYWTGLLLITRIGLMIAFALNIHGYQQLQLLLIIITCTILLFFTIKGKGIYRVHILNYFEAITITNLAFYSAIFQTLIVIPKELNRHYYMHYIALTSLSIVTLQFLLVICYCVLTSICNVCGVSLAKDKLKKWLVSKCCIKQFGQERFIKSRNFSKHYMKNYNRLSDNQYSSCTDSATDEDTWKTSVDEYREPLLSHLSY